MTVTCSVCGKRGDGPPLPRDVDDLPIGWGLAMVAFHVHGGDLLRIFCSMPCARRAHADIGAMLFGLTLQRTAN